MTYKILKSTIFTEEILLSTGRVEGYGYFPITLNTN
jgi:hypothetical protein